MEIVEPTPTAQGPAQYFTGAVWVDTIASPREENQKMLVARVRFAPGAHTAWHSHVNGQTLHVTAGVAYAQARDGNIIELHPGQSIYTPPGEEHWHGASPDSFMEHLAMVDNGEDPATTTTWLEHVTDEEYGRGPGQ